MSLNDPIDFPTAPNPLKGRKLRSKTKVKGRPGTLGRVLQGEKQKQRARLERHDLALGVKAKEIADAANAAMEAREGAFKTLKAALEPRILVSVLDAVGSGLTLKQACEELGVDPNRVRKLMARDEDYRSSYFAARESGKQLKIDMLMDIGLERAMEKSDLLYIFLMKALDPSVFNDRLVISGTGHKGEMLFGTVKDLIAESRYDKYQPSIEAEVIKSEEKVELKEEAKDGEVVRRDEERVYEEPLPQGGEEPEAEGSSTRELPRPGAPSGAESPGSEDEDPEAEGG